MPNSNTIISRQVAKAVGDARHIDGVCHGLSAFFIMLHHPTSRASFWNWIAWLVDNPTLLKSGATYREREVLKVIGQLQLPATFNRRWRQVDVGRILRNRKFVGHVRELGFSASRKIQIGQNFYFPFTKEALKRFLFLLKNNFRRGLPDLTIAYCVDGHTYAIFYHELAKHWMLVDPNMLGCCRATDMSDDFFDEHFRAPEGSNDEVCKAGFMSLFINENGLSHEKLPSLKRAFAKVSGLLFDDLIAAFREEVNSQRSSHDIKVIDDVIACLNYRLLFEEIKKISHGNQYECIDQSALFQFLVHEEVVAHMSVMKKVKMVELLLEISNDLPEVCDKYLARLGLPWRLDLSHVNKPILNLAVRRGHLWLVSWLLDAGISSSLFDKHGDCVFDCLSFLSGEVFFDVQELLYRGVSWAVRKQISFGIDGGEIRCSSEVDLNDGFIQVFIRGDSYTIERDCDEELYLTDEDREFVEVAAFQEIIRAKYTEGKASTVAGDYYNSPVYLLPVEVDDLHETFLSEFASATTDAHKLHLFETFMMQVIAWLRHQDMLSEEFQKYADMLRSAYHSTHRHLGEVIVDPSNACWYLQLGMIIEDKQLLEVGVLSFKHIPQKVNVRNLKNSQLLAQFVYVFKNKLEFGGADDELSKASAAQNQYLYQQQKVMNRRSCHQQLRCAIKSVKRCHEPCVISIHSGEEIASIHCELNGANGLSVRAIVSGQEFGSLSALTDSALDEFIESLTLALRFDIGSPTKNLLWAVTSTSFDYAQLENSLKNNFFGRRKPTSQLFEAARDQGVAQGVVAQACMR